MLTTNNKELKGMKCTKLWRYSHNPNSTSTQHNLILTHRRTGGFPPGGANGTELPSNFTQTDEIV